MALTIGTNAGFVTSTPTGNPDGTSSTADTRSNATKDTSPSTAVKIIEIGWYAEDATEEANFEVGLYSDAGNDEPETRLFIAATNAKGTGAGWKSATVDWEINENTVYWMSVQCDDTATRTDFPCCLATVTTVS